MLDIACGSGTAALVAARRFCDVTSGDYVPALLERGRERATTERVAVRRRRVRCRALDLRRDVRARLRHYAPPPPGLQPPILWAPSGT